MGDGVNIAARLEGIAKPGAICLSEDAYRQVQQRLDLKVTDLGATQLKNIAGADPRLFAGSRPASWDEADRTENTLLARAARGRGRGLSDIGRSQRLVSPRRQPPTAARDYGAGACSVERRRARRGRASLHRRAALHKSLWRSCPGLFRRRHHRKPHHRPLAHPQQLRDRPQHRLHLQGQNRRRQRDRQGTRRPLCARRLGAARPEPGARQRPTHRRGIRRASLGRPLRGRRRRPVQAAG